MSGNINLNLGDVCDFIAIIFHCWLGDIIIIIVQLAPYQCIALLASSDLQSVLVL